MGPAVVPGQDLGEAAAPVRDGAAADLAARDRQLGDGHREASAVRSAHVATVRRGECGLYRCSCQPRRPDGPVGEP